LHALPEQGLPIEIRPVVAAINRLLGRLSGVLDGQRRFMADAAHELRSPLTALSLQAERLDAIDLSPQARERLDVLRTGLARSRDLLEKLLDFARAQSDDGSVRGEVSVAPVLRQVLEDMLPLAEQRRIDLGVVHSVDARVALGEFRLGTLLRNLVDNAIRYTPPGGRIDLGMALEGDSVRVDVADSGPGIAPEERERVFEAFHRLPGSSEAGSGLGLAIVKAIADRNRVEIRLDDADRAARSGLRVSLLLPLAEGTGLPR
jgi:two-component system OmpR family sensor kinase